MKHLDTKNLRRILFLVLGVFFVACGSIDPDPPEDADGNPIPLPPPGEPWLIITEILPDEALSPHPTISITFNSYLDPSSFTSFGFAQLRSGGFVYGGRTEYFMARKELRFRPNNPMFADLVYELSLPGRSSLRSVQGSPLHPLVLLPRYHVRADRPYTDPIERPRVTWEEVEEIFDAHCNACHGDPSWQLPTLDRQGLVGVTSTQVEFPLVEPYSPARSYLMHKILPDYPQRRFTVQPPPYSDADPLTTEQIETIEHWIAHGAR